MATREMAKKNRIPVTLIYNKFKNEKTMFKGGNKKFKQTKNVFWLNTPIDTIWKNTGPENYIQPENLDFWDTLFGVDLDLLDEEELEIFEEL